MPAHTNRPLPVGPSAVDTAYTLTLLSEYAYTLDTLPLELSRYFADLRELDAVLSSSMVSITAKIHRLTSLIEQGNAAGAADSAASASGSGAPDAVEIRARKEDRLYLLADIAEEVSRLKPGAEDKIRVACLAADTLKAHAAHMTALLDQAPVADYEEANVDRQTVFPHVGKGFAGTALFEVRGKRRAAAAGVITAHAHAVLESPAKRRRGARDEDDPAYGRSPRKDKTANGRNGVRPKKNDRAPSPAESLVSITSQQVPSSSRLAAQATLARHNSAASGANKRSRSYQDDPRAFPANGAYAGQAGWPPFDGGVAVGARGTAAAFPPISSGASAALGLHSAGADDGEDGQDAVEEADDGRTYCLCNGPSHGEMIACDDESCAREWFHLACLGMISPPEGSWFCDMCKQKRAAVRRGGRGGKRKAIGRGK